MLTFPLVLMLACAIIYYKVGELEHSSGFAMAGVSLALWLMAAQLFGWGYLGALAVQGALFVALTVWNMRRQRPK